MKKVKNIPKFKNEKEENTFWQKSDTTQYIEWKKTSVAIFQDLKPSTKSISMRLPNFTIDEINQ